RNQERKSAIVNLSKTNNIRRINKFFEAVNALLPYGGTYIGCVETIQARKTRKRISKIPVLRDLYFMLEFIFLRVFPKVYGLKKLYFLVTRGRNRLLSKAETLGRLVCCGFDIKDHTTINGLLYFVVQKVSEPTFDMK